MSGGRGLAWWAQLAGSWRCVAASAESGGPACADSRPFGAEQALSWGTAGEDPSGATVPFESMSLEGTDRVAGLKVSEACEKAVTHARGAGDRPGECRVGASYGALAGGGRQWDDSSLTLGGSSAVAVPAWLASV